MILEWFTGFPYFLQFQSEFGNKEFMMWATVSSWSCFCWLYRALPSSAAKNISNLILVLTIWWCPCVELSLILLDRVFAMTSVFSWPNSLWLCPAYFVLQGQACLLFQVSLDFLLLHFSPLWWKRHLFLVLVLEGFICLDRTIQLKLLWH